MQFVLESVGPSRLAPVVKLINHLNLTNIFHRFLNLMRKGNYDGKTMFYQFKYQYEFINKRRGARLWIILNLMYVSS